MFETIKFLNLTVFLNSTKPEFWPSHNYRRKLYTW